MTLLEGHLTSFLPSDDILSWQLGFPDMVASCAVSRPSLVNVGQIEAFHPPERP